MADISKCTGHEFLIRDKCYRFAAKKSLFQSFIAVVPYDKENKRCIYFWKNE